MSLSDMFLAHMGNAAGLAGGPQLEGDLEALLDAGRAAWPGIDVEPAAFLRSVANGLPKKGDVREAVQTTHGGDLYLACACALGDPVAATALEDRYLAPLWARLARNKAFLRFDEDSQQQMRTRLLVGEPGGSPSIATYGGRGPLAGWLSVVATRLAIDLCRLERPQQSLEDMANRIGNADISPELGYLKARYGKDVEEALRAALASLPTHETAILRLYYFEEATAEAIARMYGVNRRTVHRWLEDIQLRIFVAVRDVLADRLRLSPTELDSLIGLVQSQIAVSLQGQAELSEK